MRFKLILSTGALVSLFWLGPVQASCTPNGSNPAGAEKCVQTTDEGLCNANVDCIWSAPEMPSEVNTPKPAPINEKEIVKLTNPLSEIEISTIVGNAINAAMGIMGSLALVVFVYGGFRWLTAAGNSEHVEAGTSAMVWATIGIFIIFSSYAILQLVFNAIGAQNRGTTTQVTGGAGGTYCLVNCTAANSCEEITQAAGQDFEALDKKCTESNYSIQKKNCTEVAVCKK